MSTKIGYLIPTRESVMEGRPQTAPLLRLAERAEDLGYDSLWLGDSLLARPRHEPLTLLAGLATRTRTVELGTAVLLPALRNPVVMAHQAATLDQLCEGRLILGVGIAGDVANIRAEFEAAGVTFEKRVGRMMEGLRLCRALWTGEAVNWDGRWTVREGVLGPLPHRPGGPPIWGGGSHPDGLKRAGRSMDGWFPTGPNDPAAWQAKWHTVRQHAVDAGRAAAGLTGALYLTLAVADDSDKAAARVDEFLESYYGVPSQVIRRRQACFGGPAEAVAEWIAGFIEAGVQHLVLRFAGDHDRHLELLAKLRSQHGW
ncbi:MAG: LLM class flavin-dependent oxidoreductase [Gammaproteobacteria bacterium]|nr:LLM class flavin-dependent oxidoreductase [Gammaproteobacteria bacterium]